MTRILGLALALMIGWLIPPAWADRAAYTDMTLQNAATATGNGVNLAVDAYNSVTFSTVISATATVTFEGAADPTTGFVSLVCVSIADTARTKVVTATATGVFQCNVAGLQAVRARISAYTSGTITVNARATTAVFAGN